MTSPPPFPPRPPPQVALTHVEILAIVAQLPDHPSPPKSGPPSLPHRESCPKITPHDDPRLLPYG